MHCSKSSHCVTVSLFRFIFFLFLSNCMGILCLCCIHCGPANDLLSACMYVCVCVCLLYQCCSKMMVCCWLFAVASAFIVPVEPESSGSHVLRFLLDYRMLTVSPFYCIRFRFCKFALCSSFALIPCSIHAYTEEYIISAYVHRYVCGY
ncbi:uncharacterized protein DEA37_0006313 [Paragonimus westermani]|uniref:Uncharacterized protein n=1 Tax=Paragonimus westermani TaxID=34504 RepID=A0A5J4NCF2_9TREM|nr:uncharacterized protein DEA37_0006313 [Paragonimus westermani]